MRKIVFLKARILFLDSCFYKSHPTAYTIFLMSPHVMQLLRQGLLSPWEKGHLVTGSKNARYPYFTTGPPLLEDMEKSICCVLLSLFISWLDPPPAGQGSLSGNLHPFVFLPPKTRTEH